MLSDDDSPFCSPRFDTRPLLHALSSVHELLFHRSASTSALEDAAAGELRRVASASVVEDLSVEELEVVDADAALCCRLSRARQTLDWVSRTRMRYARLDKGVLTVPQALLLLRACPPISMRLVLGEAGPPTRHLGPALLLATRLLAEYPQQRWLAFAGLLHAMGRLLMHPAFGAAPAWEVVGETFPVGCRFDSRISFHHWFGANPDRRKRLYGTPFGIYNPRCGLADVDMSWSGDEYVTEVLLRNRCPVPPHALFCLRYGSFTTLGGGSSYEKLMDEEDLEALPWLACLRAAKLAAYSDTEAAVRAEANAEALLESLQGLIHEFAPGRLCL